jgi:CspA family cold shock protein
MASISAMAFAAPSQACPALIRIGDWKKLRTVEMPRGTVKFFNDAKGFGFIAPEDGGPDVFVHVSAVERAGLGGLGEGDEIAFEIEQDRRSGKASAVDLVVTGHGAPSPQRSSRPGFASRGRGFDHDEPRRGGAGSRAPAGSGSGVVKWFNPTKGFGFIQPSDGGDDVFVHISAVERAGLRELQDGQAVAYDIEQDRRTGKASATNLRLER